MLLNSSAGPVPGPCAMRVTVPSSTFQSTSASISRSSPADFSAFIQLRISPKATGFRCTVISGSPVSVLVPSLGRSFGPEGFAGGSLAFCSDGETLGGGCDLGHEVADEGLVGQRREGHFARLEPRRAGVDGLAVEFQHALLAGVGIDAGEADRERRVLVDADPAQAIEHRL